MVNMPLCYASFMRRSLFHTTKVRTHTQYLDFYVLCHTQRFSRCFFPSTQFKTRLACARPEFGYYISINLFIFLLLLPFEFNPWMCCCVFFFHLKILLLFLCSIHYYNHRFIFPFIYVVLNGILAASNKMFVVAFENRFSKRNTCAYKWSYASGVAAASVVVFGGLTNE